MEISKIIKAETPQTRPANTKVEKAANAQKACEQSQNTQTPQAVSKDELVKAVQDLEVNFNLKVEMTTDEATGRDVVRIFSEDGKRLLRPMPPDQVLQMAAQARQGTLENLLNSRV